VGDNNEIMAASELMTSKQSCEHSIAVIQAEAAAAPLYDQSEDRGSGHRRAAPPSLLVEHSVCPRP
ncbi:MAG: DUF1508 domain-containing protein, partial [Thermoleophilia bacterium]|nr:DUF1508 domain-containing protein [Thermoleophilia bacterium]